jgi:hypothetical protein
MAKAENEITLEKNLSKITRKTTAMPTLKAILVICDDYESAENNGISQSVKVDLATLTRFLDVLEKRGIAKVEKTLLQGRKATLANINNAVKNVTAGPDDIVLFYFSGHGGMEKGKTFIFTSDEQNLDRGKLQTAINAKPARLKIILTDACSNAIDGIMAARTLGMGAGGANEGKFDAVYKDLFLNHQGTLHISASSEGQYAWSTDTQGGIFTYYFIKENLTKNPVNSWDQMFKDAQRKTMQDFNRMPEAQRKKLAAEGITNQTPKTFSMPVIKGKVITTPVTDPVVNPQKPQIFIANQTNKAVAITLELPTGKDKKSIAPNATLPLAQNKLVVSFNKNGTEYAYELIPGKYFFGIYNGEMDLYLDDDRKNNQNTTQQTNTLPNVIGKWEWEDEEGTTVSTFKQDGTFVDKDSESGEVITKGTWQLISQKIGNRTESVMVFKYKDEEVTYQLFYIISSDEEGVMQLILNKMTEDGKTVELTADDKKDSVIVMYKQD